MVQVDVMKVDILVGIAQATYGYKTNYYYKS